MKTLPAFFAATCVLAGWLEGTAGAQAVIPRVVATFPHDRQAFTQGLLLFEGKLFESTGLLGQSTLRRSDPVTGAVEQRVQLEATLFGEGLARVDRALIQLTWKNGVAIVYDLDGLTELRRHAYDGEGWGLCDDGARLVMSDGSSKLFFRDRSTFALRGEIEVLSAGEPVTNLNELECVGALVYANVWQTNRIVRIDPLTGLVLTEIDASGLLTDAEATAADVLNGIAYDRGTRHFYLTGKLWPRLFEVAFDFDPEGTANPDAGAPDARGAAVDALVEAGVASPATGGCSCAVAGTGSNTSEGLPAVPGQRSLLLSSLLSLSLSFLVVGARRRRGTRAGSAARRGVD